MEPGPADDADLLRAHGGGDRHAFGRLYDRYDRQCFQFIRRTLGPAHAEAAEDLHQDTWMSVAAHAGAYDARKSSFATCCSPSRATRSGIIFASRRWRFWRPERTTQP